MPERAVLLIGAASLIAACSDDARGRRIREDAGTIDAGVRHDAAVRRDAGRDAAVSRDAGTDAAFSPEDAGSRLDAGAAPCCTTPRRSASVFLLGHSLVNFDMPAMLADLAADAGLTHAYSAKITPGAPLRWHWEHPEEGTGEDPHAALPSGRFDVFVMTEGSAIEEHLAYNDTIGYATRFAQLALSGNASTQIYLYEVWPELDAEWRDRVEARRSLYERVADEVSARIGVRVSIVPGGRALSALIQRVEAGEVPGLSSRHDLFEDQIHLGDLGNYFIALVLFSTIYEQSPVGLTRTTDDPWGNPYVAPSEEVARAMQEIAWEVVSSDPRAH